MFTSGQKCVVLTEYVYKPQYYFSLSFLYLYIFVASQLISPITGLRCPQGSQIT